MARVKRRRGAATPSLPKSFFDMDGDAYSRWSNPGPTSIDVTLDGHHVPVWPVGQQLSVPNRCVLDALLVGLSFEGACK